MQARMYLPWFGRFASPDPALDQHFQVTQSWNIYSYVMNNPTMSIDPTGMVTQEEVERRSSEVVSNGSDDKKPQTPPQPQTSQAEETKYLPTGNPDTFFNRWISPSMWIYRIVGGPVDRSATDRATAAMTSEHSDGHRQSQGAQDLKDAQAKARSEAVKQAESAFKATGMPGVGLASALQDAKDLYDAAKGDQAAKKKAPGIVKTRTKSLLKKGLSETTKKTVERVEKVVDTVTGG